MVFYHTIPLFLLLEIITQIGKQILHLVSSKKIILLLFEFGLLFLGFGPLRATLKIVLIAVDMTKEAFPEAFPNAKYENFHTKNSLNSATDNCWDPRLLC